MPSASRITVAVEEGRRRSFASAVDWPGWCRSGRDTAGALAALESYRQRYAPVARLAKLVLPRAALAVADTVAGTATTDFGAPAVVVRADLRRVDRDEAERLVSLLQACWQTLDDVAAHAPRSLRKGPRGGGRDRDEIVEHVVNAERAYARKVGVTLTAAEWREGGVALMRARLADVLSRPTRSSGSSDRWPPRYLIRRTAWHALDHAWEMQDRSS